MLLLVCAGCVFVVMTGGKKGAELQTDGDDVVPREAIQSDVSPKAKAKTKPTE